MTDELKEEDEERLAGVAAGGKERRKIHMAEILLDISRRVTTIDSLDEIIATLVEMATATLGAERSTIFLNDPETGELYSRFAEGNLNRSIRMHNTSGIAGHVFTSGEGMIISDVATDDLFNADIDKQTGFITKSILCCPIKTFDNSIIGVAQVLNKKKGVFDADDMTVLEVMTRQASVALLSSQIIEKMNEAREKELEFLDVVSDITSEIDLGTILSKVMYESTRMLKAERSTLFLNDEKSGELWSEVGEGIETTEIRFPNDKGIAGAVFTSGVTINIPHAYADLRFNPSFDKQTGFFTRSILCAPVVNKDGEKIGVTQVLNKRGGVFTDEDESRLRAFTAQVSIALENAKLFNDVQNMKNYNEGMLQSMSNGVITLDDEARIVTCNHAALSIFGVTEEEIVEKRAKDFFTDANPIVLEMLERVADTGEAEYLVDVALELGAKKVSANLNVLPLLSVEDKSLGKMIVIEDITGEKRMKSTMSRYMDPDLANNLLSEGSDILGGHNVDATLLFTDIRGFTTLTEELGAQGTVSLLNEYFTIMVDCIQAEGGMLDKFIGDAIMAAFGIPVSHDDDEDRAMRTAISMLRELHQWNSKRIADGMKPVDMGIGINTDSVVSGNIGSPRRMDYTIIGDGVNLAARLESACKQYSAKILISEHTYKLLKGTYRIRDIDDVVVKGKTKPVRIFEVLDYHSDESFPNLMETVEHFKEGRKAYRAGTFAGAIKSFKKALKLNPSDRLSEFYIQRCELLKADPALVGKEWDGIWRMTSK